MQAPEELPILGRPERLPPQTTTPDLPETPVQLLARVLRLIEHQTTVLEHLCARVGALENLLRNRTGHQEDTP